MAEETVVKESQAAAATTEAVVTEAAAVAEPTPQLATETKEETTKEATPEAEKPTGEEPPPAAAASEVAAVPEEESNIVEDPEKKAVDELKELIVAALANNEFTPPPPPPPIAAAAEEPPIAEEIAAAAPAEVDAPVKDEIAATPAEAEVPVKEEIATTPAEVEAPVTEENAATPAEVEAPPAADPPVEEKSVVVEEEDGAKTVEAIEETVVPVTAAEEVTPTEPAAPPPEEVVIWGVPLLGDEKSDTILLKFLRARDFKVKDALAMIKNTVIWRKQFGIADGGLIDEDLGVPAELDKVVFMQGHDKEGHPVCYNVFGEFQDKELYGKAFGDSEKRDKFLKWRIQFLERGIRQHLDFTPGGVSTMVQVNDLKGVAGPGRKELRQATKQALALLQDNYPEFVAKQVFINVPWWYLAYNQILTSILTPRSKSKFVFSGPSRTTETLFKYIAPEQVPVQYGGLSKDNDPDFTAVDTVTEVVIKPSSKHTIEIPSTETSLLVWEFRVLGWDVSYGAEFVPSAEDGYTVIVTKARKFIVTDEPVVKNNFKNGEPGKVVLTFENPTSKKKKLLYRSKVKSATESV